MRPVDGAVGPTSASGLTARDAAARRADALRLLQGVDAADGRGRDAAPAFDPLAAVVQAAHDAAAPPAAGLQARLLDWAAPTTRQFEAVSPARLLTLLSLAVERLAAEAGRSDDLGDLGAAALERELRDHQALAERRATLVEP